MTGYLRDNAIAYFELDIALAFEGIGVEPMFEEEWGDEALDDAALNVTVPTRGDDELIFSIVITEATPEHCPRPITLYRWVNDERHWYGRFRASEVRLLVRTLVYAWADNTALEYLERLRPNKTFGYVSAEL